MCIDQCLSTCILKTICDLLYAHNIYTLQKELYAEQLREEEMAPRSISCQTEVMCAEKEVQVSPVTLSKATMANVHSGKSTGTAHCIFCSDF